MKVARLFFGMSVLGIFLSPCARCILAGHKLEEARSDGQKVAEMVQSYLKALEQGKDVRSFVDRETDIPLTIYREGTFVSQKIHWIAFDPDLKSALAWASVQLEEADCLKIIRLAKTKSSWKVADDFWLLEKKKGREEGASIPRPKNEKTLWTRMVAETFLHARMLPEADRPWPDHFSHLWLGFGTDGFLADPKLAEHNRLMADRTWKKTKKDRMLEFIEEYEAALKEAKNPKERQEVQALYKEVEKDLLRTLEETRADLKKAADHGPIFPCFDSWTIRDQQGDKDNRKATFQGVVSIFKYRADTNRWQILRCLFITSPRSG